MDRRPDYVIYDLVQGTSHCGKKSSRPNLISSVHVGIPTTNVAIRSSLTLYELNQRYFVQVRFKLNVKNNATYLELLDQHVPEICSTSTCKSMQIYRWTNTQTR